MFGKKHDTATTDEMPTPQPITAGCGRVATEAEIDALLSQFHNKPVSREEKAFIFGFMTGLQFLVVPADCETYGMSAADYEENAFKWFLHDNMQDEVRQVISILSGFVGDDNGE